MPESTEAPRRPAPSGRSLRHALRIAFIAGIEEESRTRRGRGLTDEELRRALRAYRGA